MDNADPQNLTQFDIVPDYKVRSTTFEVVAPGREMPVARLHRDENVSAAGPSYRVLAGPALDIPVGVVNESAAGDMNRRRIGTVSAAQIRRGSVGLTWEVFQDGLGKLFGEQAGGKFGGVYGLDTVTFGLTDLAELRIRFSGEESPGFDLVKPTGITKRCTFTVHDPRIDRLLLFSCFLCLEMNTISDPRRFVAETVRSFDPGTWLPRKKPRR